MIEIKWEQMGNDENDLIANYEDYILRVERMHKKRFWWCLYFKNDEVIMDDCGVTGSTLSEGKKLVEVAFWTHRRTVNK